MSAESPKKSATHPNLLAGGKPGNRGGGRLPDAFKARMQKLLDRKDVEKYLGECLAFKHGEGAYFKALEFAAERGEGKVPNVTKIEGGDEPLKIIVEHTARASDA